MFVTKRRHEILMAEQRDVWRAHLAEASSHTNAALERVQRAEETTKHCGIALQDTKRRLTIALTQLETVRESETRWRELAIEAHRAVVALQLRHAPPEPIEGEVAQPPSVDRADREAAAALRDAEKVAAHA
jgi:hypothetical protein